MIYPKSESSIAGDGRGELTEITENWHPLNTGPGTKTAYPGKRNKVKFDIPTTWRRAEHTKRCDKQGDKDEDNSCYIIAEWFFIIIFLWLYLIIRLVRLRSIRLSAHIECRCSRSRAKDVTITNVIIKTPDRKWVCGVKDVMLGSDGLGFLVIFEKAVSWDLTLSEASWDSDLGESSWVYGMCHAFGGSVRWDLKLAEASPVCGLRDAQRVCWVRWNGQHSKNCVSLSSCRKTKEVNKRFVSKLKKVDSVSGFLCIWKFYLSVYFTYLYMLHGGWSSFLWR